MYRAMKALACATVLALVCAVIAPRPAAAATGFHAAWLDQSPWPVLSPGATTSYTVRFRNTGDQTWQRGVAGRQVNLAVSGDSTAFADAGMAVGWLNANRVATTVEDVVAPSAIATFTFTLRAPSAPGPYRQPLHPVLEGVFRNTGSRTWNKGILGEEARLGINMDDAQWAPLAVNWPFSTRVAAQAEQTVPPGATATFTFQIRAPSSPGSYSLHLRPVVDGAWWMEDEGVFLTITVPGVPVGSGNAPTLTTTTVQSGLSFPWDVAFAPDGRMFVTERAGNILVYASAAPGAPQLANNAVSGIRAEGEAGAMGLAIDPGFAANHFVYVCASRTDSGWLNQVLRYREANNVLTLDGFVIRTGIFAGGNHDGCRIRFGPDGKLWITMGEVGNTAFSQNPNALNGKILRMNPDGTVPEDNPILPGAFGRTAAYTMGLNGLYLNIKGREKQGIVDPADAEALKIEIQQKLNGLKDPDSGAVGNRPRQRPRLGQG